MAAKALTDILAEEQLIGPNQLEQARRAAERAGTPLVSVLLEQGLVAEEALYRALQRHLSLPVFDPQNTDIDVDAVREIPAEDANRLGLLPVELKHDGGRRVLRVAMADPLDRQTIEEIEFTANGAVEPMIGRSSDVSEAIRAHYRSVTTRIVPRARGAAPATPAKSARTPFGGNLETSALGTRPLPRIEQGATPAQRIDALVSLLVGKGVITRREYEERLRQHFDSEADDS